MDFTKGEILEMKLRLIAFAVGSGVRESRASQVCDSQTPSSVAEAISRSDCLQISPLVKSISGGLSDLFLVVPDQNSRSAPLDFLRFNLLKGRSTQVTANGFHQR
jgi:hypothetical protein